MPALHDLPLQHYQLFHTRDVDEARECVARVFCPHALKPLRSRDALDARQHSVRLHQEVSLNYVQYGAAVAIEPGYLRDFYLLQMPLRGQARVRCGAQQVEAHAGLATLPSPSEPLQMQWGRDSPHLILRFSKSALLRQLERLAQAPVHQPLVFELGVPMDAPALSPLLNFVRYLCSSYEQEAGLGAPGLAAQAEDYLLTSLLLLAPHNHSARLQEAGRRSLLPRSVRQALEFMHGRATEPASLAELCAQLGVSARALQTAFREHTGQSPMAYWRELRLDRARARLQAARAGDGLSVSDVAGEFGFLHLGHFATHYQQRFGESPAQTLRRARG